MQAWGVKSRFTVRATELAPSKSGIIGMLAAAAGRRRTDPIEDLLSLRFGVRKDQPGTVLRDFHTAVPTDGRKPMPLSERYYLADAVFLAGIEGDQSLLEGLEEAVRKPIFPLYLGRRSCPPTQPISLGLRNTGLLEALKNEPWLASTWFRRRHNHRHHAEILLDREAVPNGEHTGDIRGARDVPVSYDPRHREYAFRDIERLTVTLGDGIADHHDPMSQLEEVHACS